MEMMILLLLLAMVACLSSVAAAFLVWWLQREEDTDEEPAAPPPAPPRQPSVYIVTPPQKEITQLVDLRDGIYKTRAVTPFHFEAQMLYYSVPKLGLSFLQNLGNGTKKYFIKDTRVYRLGYDETTLTREGTIFGDVGGFRLELKTGEKLVYAFEPNYPLMGTAKLEVDTMKEATGDYLEQLRSTLQPYVAQMV